MTTHATALEFIKEAATHTAPPMGRVDINQRHKGATKKPVVHDAITGRNFVIDRDKTLAAINRAVD